MALLEVANLHQHSGKTQLLHEISLAAQAQAIVALLGPNGAGKTTLLRTLIGLLPCAHLQANTIRFDDNDITRRSVAERVQAGLLYLPQHTSLLQQLSVHDNLHIVFQYHPWWQKKDSSAFIEERNHWLTVTGLTQTLRQPAGTLSGGQKRKLEVVRSLLMKPKLLMLDEPFAGVDPKSIYELKALFTSLSGEGLGIIISDHHVDQLLSMAATGYVVVQGRIVASGGIKDILENRYTKERYLGAEFHEAMAARFSSHLQKG
ncbi:ATP-binding cassette domain-containing protein [bacterium]|nr:ATP-binding cassette domain-containing protein [bacterium]